MYCKLFIIFTILFIIFNINKFEGKECYTGYSGTKTEVCENESYQCYKMFAEIYIGLKIKVAGCSKYRCLVS